MNKLNTFSDHSLWFAGFRPFFILAITMGAFLPIYWALMFSGQLSWAPERPLIWHAHEIFYGFGAAVLIGFLLTASKNWVKVRGINGKPLIVLVLLWIFERFTFSFVRFESLFLKHFLMSLFLAGAGSYIIYTLFKNRRADSYKDNYFFVIQLCSLLIAKNLLLTEAYSQFGISMTIGLFRLAFVLMFERTITQFMKNTEGVDLKRIAWLDYSIKIFAVLCVFQSVFPEFISIAVLTIFMLLLFFRWIIWRPNLGFKSFGNATMYFGYLGIIIHLVFEVLKLANIWSWGTISIHIFTFLCMGVVIPSMVVRISKGHTGRKPQFENIEKLAIYLIGISAVFRLVLPIITPNNYFLFLKISGLFWTFAYLILAYKLVPFLLSPRIDGKLH